MRAALAIASRGLPVLPCWWTDTAGRCACGGAEKACKPGKHPVGRLVPNGAKGATLDPGTIERWWRRQPKANVAIATGGPPRLLVIDVDPDTGGEVSLANLEAEHGGVPETVEVITPRGGRHLYFFVPSGRPMPTISAGKLGDGVDTRGQGGYVLAPPSTIAGRPYAWSVDSAGVIATAPVWLLDRLGKGGSSSKATDPAEWLRLVTEGVKQGARNDSIARISGLLLRRMAWRDPKEVELVAELVACWNATKCDPPLEAEELKRTLDSIADREMQRRGLSQ